MPVDNTLYQRRPHDWWTEDGVQQFLLTSAHPVRFGYFRSILERHDVDPQTLRLLDIGSGGGYLTESFARIGSQVTGIDPAAASVAVADDHARGQALAIDYAVGAGERLPFADASFDAVTCCDVLEHVDNLTWVLRETARVLRPGGFYFFDTVNRTPQSWLLMVQIPQRFPLTRFMPPGLHDWSLFIKPEELETRLAVVDIRVRQLVGINSTLNPLALLWLIVQIKMGTISHGEFGRRAQVKAVPGDFSLAYMGYGIKAR